MTRAEIIWGVEEEGKVVLEVTRNARGVAGGWIGIQTVSTRNSSVEDLTDESQCTQDGIQMVQL
jgi:hypothetical protein